MKGLQYSFIGTVTNAEAERIIRNLGQSDFPCIIFFRIKDLSQYILIVYTKSDGNLSSRLCLPPTLVIL